MTLDGPELAPRDTLIPLDANEVTDTLAHRFEDLLTAAERVGYSSATVRAALERAFTRWEAGAEHQAE